VSLKTLVNFDSGSTDLSSKAGMSGRLYYVTVLSNLVRGYDKYGHAYDKSGIPESDYPDQFFLLTEPDLHFGVRKASSLLSKLGIPGDQIIALETHVPEDTLRPNLRTGIGRFVERSWIGVDEVYLFDETGALISSRIEEAFALSQKLHIGSGKTYECLIPRSVSFLPVASACQAHCPFCFSKASVSAEITAKRLDWDRVAGVLQAGKRRGATRVVITGGGEPSLLGDADLDRLIRESASLYPKVVLISNGFKWGSMTAEARESAVRNLDAAGLSVLALSRHHSDSRENALLMGLNTSSERIAETWLTIRRSLSRLTLRWFCVLQRRGIENRHSLKGYLDWAVDCGVEEICFKELYVSASVESEYFDQAANKWSAENQVSLRLVLDFAKEAGWSLAEKLPWGAPVFEGLWRGQRMRVAAYTEPSVFWELSNGICRSWNLMADGRCLASLEDRNSEVLARGLCKLQTPSH
jgi:molybdenum cofactor biosynthesis enzyme MoaA